MSDRRNIVIPSLVAALLLAMPASVFAAAQITEIEYDPPGSNAGHQWIQIYNVGDASIDLSSYKLLQNGTNHGVSIVSGTTTLPGGAVAIIANNPSTFASDYPDYSGAVFKSAFSLRAAGDSVVLKDAKLNPVDTAAFGSADGGSGDGNALYRSGQSWLPGAPDPSSYHVMPPPAIVAAAPPAPGAAKPPKTSLAKSSYKTSVSRKTTSSSIAAAIASPDSSANQLAAPQPGGAYYPLIEIVAGSAAFGIVIIAGMLLSARFAPQPQPVPVVSEFNGDSPKHTSEADEYDIVEGSDTFL